MAFILDPQTGKITFGVVADLSHDAISIDLASQFGVSETFKDNFSLSAPDFTDNFSSDNWTEDGSGDFTISGGVMNWETDDTILNHFSFRDILGQTVSDTEWTLRFKLDVENFAQGSDTTNQELYITLADTTNTATESNQDAIGLRLVVDNSLSEIRMINADGNNLQNSSGTLLSTNISATTFFVEIKRTSATGSTISLFSDENYSTLIESASVVIPSTITDLRYMRIQNRDGLDGTNDHTLDGIIDDVQFFDGETVLTNWSQTGTDISINTTTKEVDWSVPNSSTDDAISHDLGTGNVSDTLWLLRFKVDIQDFLDNSSSTGQNIFVGLTDANDSIPADTAQDGICFRIVTKDTKDRYELTHANGQTLFANLVGTTRTLSVETLFVELKRTSATGATLNLYSDSNYTVLLESISATISSGITGLRYIKIQAFEDDGASNGTLDGIIDDVQFWDGITVPVITSNNWRMRFTLDITDLNLVSGSDLSMWIGLSDKDATSKSNQVNDSFLLATFVDSGAKTFSIGTADNQQPRASGSDVIMTTVPIVDTFFVEMKRNSDSQTTMSFYTDSTFTTTSETKTQTGISGTDNLKYLKLFNDVLGNNANTMDGTFDDFTFTNLEVVTVETDETFTVDALLDDPDAVDETFLVDAFVQALGDNGCAIIFADDFANATNWTQTGTQVTIASGEIQGWGADAGTQRLTHDLVTPLNDNSWIVEFEFEFSAENNTAHDILVLTDTDTTSSGLQDHIACRFGSSNLPRFALLHGVNGQIGAGTADLTSASTGVRYFCRLERLSTTSARLTIFTTGFDVTTFATINVTLASGLTGLQFVISETSDLGGAGRTLTGIIDNLSVKGCKTFDVDAILVVLFTTIDEEFLVDAILSALEEFTVDARLAQRELFDVDAFAQATQTETFDVDSFLKATQTFNFTIDGLLFITPSELFCIDALIQDTFDEDFTVDARLSALEEFNVDARLAQRELFDTDAFLQDAFDEDFTVDGRVVLRIEKTFLVDAFTQEAPQIPLEFIVDSRIVRQIKFDIDAVVRYAQGSAVDQFGAIPDLIIRVLRENVTLTGRGIVDEIVIITTAENFPFRGKNSRIKNWLNRLRLDGLIQEDGSSPDWYKTIWSLV